MTQFGAGAIGASINAANIGNTGRQVRTETRQERERRLQQAANAFDPDSLSGTRERIRGFRRQRLIERGIDPDQLDRRLDQNQTSVKRLRRDRVQLGQRLRDAEASGDDDTASQIRQRINLIADTESDLLSQRRDAAPLARGTLADLPDQERLEIRRQGREDLNAQLPEIADANRRAEDRDFGARLSREAEAGRDLLRRAGDASLAQEVSDERAAEFFRGADPAEQDIVLRGVPLPEADRSTSDRIQSLADEGRALAPGTQGPPAPDSARGGVGFPEIGPGRTALDRPGGDAAASRLAEGQLDAETRRNIAERLEETGQDRLLRTAENASAQADNRARELAVEAQRLESQGDVNAARQAAQEAANRFREARFIEATRRLTNAGSRLRGGGQGGDGAGSSGEAEADFGGNVFSNIARKTGNTGSPEFALAYHPPTVIDNLTQGFRNDNPEAISQIRSAISNANQTVSESERRELARAVLETIEQSGVEDELENNALSLGDIPNLALQAINPLSESGGAVRRQALLGLADLTSLLNQGTSPSPAEEAIAPLIPDRNASQRVDDIMAIGREIMGETGEEFRRLMQTLRSLAGRE